MAAVRQMITIATDLSDAAEAVGLCRRYEQVRCAVGIHPNYSAQAQAADVERLREIQSDLAVLAIGEMGLDYHYGDVPRPHQRAIFEAQLQLARDANKPAVIHCREAIEDTLAVMRGFADVPAVFHCFTGTADEARRILDAGYLLGFTGPITFKKNNALREVVKLTPMDRLLVETDAPYLSPEPVRKIKTNEPAFVMHTARLVAQIKQMPVEEVDRVTTENACRLFTQITPIPTDAKERL